MMACRLWNDEVTEEEELRQHASTRRTLLPSWIRRNSPLIPSGICAMWESFIALKRRVDAAELAHIPTSV